MFGYKFYPNPENFTPSRMVWSVTFSKSDLPPHSSFYHSSPYTYILLNTYLPYLFTLPHTYISHRTSSPSIYLPHTSTLPPT